MKIGIITFHASFNYGSMLQAWAMQTYMENLGHVVEIVNFRSKAQKNMYHRPIDSSSLINILSGFKRMLLHPSSILPLNKKWKLFDDFLNSQFHLSKEYNSISDLYKEKFDFDVLICGSDQIWNTGIPDFGLAYFGNFVGEKTTKISYAVSMGQMPQNTDVDIFKKNVIGFDAISVREPKTRDVLINNGITIDAEVVCDPTLLLDVSYYKKLIENQERLIKEPYAFFYTPVGLPYDYFEIASSIGRKFGIKVVTEKAYYPKDIKKYKIEEYLITGPKEFLNLIQNASLVIGGSFHLQVFSILFHKDFYCINGDKDSRTNNLLNILGLDNRIISLDNPVNYDLNSISYNEVDAKLKNYINSSEKWLNEMLIKKYKNDSK